MPETGGQDILIPHVDHFRVCGYSYHDCMLNGEALALALCGKEGRAEHNDQDMAEVGPDQLVEN